MPLLERVVQVGFIRKCRAQGWDAMKLETPGRAGSADVLVLFTDNRGLGHAAFVEMKRPGEVPGRLQAHRHEELRRRGFIAFWSDNAGAAFERMFHEIASKGIVL